MAKMKAGLRSADPSAVDENHELRQAKAEPSSPE
jgi:hypothetical protein